MNAAEQSRNSEIRVPKSEANPKTEPEIRAGAPCGDSLQPANDFGCSRAEHPTELSNQSPGPAPATGPTPPPATDSAPPPATGLGATLVPDAAPRNSPAGLLPVSASPNLPAGLPPALLLASPAKPAPISIGAAIGRVVGLSEADQLRLMTLEYSINESIAQGWRSFVDIGLALIEIKKAELYAGEFETFEEYCRVQWDFKRSKAKYLMAAAQVVKSLAALPDVPKPERESPLRPLLKLKPEDAQRAWRLAVEKTGGRRITARVVQNAVQELKLGDEPANGRSAKSQRLDRHQGITNCFGDLLKLLSQRAEYGAVVEKVEELHGLVEGLFAKRQPRVKC
jgi:hypothetical protein